MRPHENHVVAATRVPADTSDCHIATHISCCEQLWPCETSREFSPISNHNIVVFQPNIVRVVNDRKLNIECEASQHIAKLRQIDWSFGWKTGFRFLSSGTWWIKRKQKTSQQPKKKSSRKSVWVFAIVHRARKCANSNCRAGSINFQCSSRKTFNKGPLRE